MGGKVQIEFQGQVFESKLQLWKHYNRKMPEEISKYNQFITRLGNGDSVELALFKASHIKKRVQENSSTTVVVNIQREKDLQEKIQKVVAKARIRQYHMEEPVFEEMDKDDYLNGLYGG